MRPRLESRLSIVGCLVIRAWCLAWGRVEIRLIVRLAPKFSLLFLICWIWSVFFLNFCLYFLFLNAPKSVLSSYPVINIQLLQHSLFYSLRSYLLLYCFASLVIFNLLHFIICFSCYDMLVDSQVISNQLTCRLSLTFGSLLRVYAYIFLF